MVWLCIDSASVEESSCFFLSWSLHGCRAVPRKSGVRGGLYVRTWCWPFQTLLAFFPSPIPVCALCAVDEKGAGAVGQQRRPTI